jgi:hypothetical protein
MAVVEALEQQVLVQMVVLVVQRHSGHLSAQVVVQEDCVVNQQVLLLVVLVELLQVFDFFFRVLLVDKQ